MLDEDQWARLPTSVRRRLSAQTLGAVIRAATAAVNRGGFDPRGSTVARLGLDLDEEGWLDVAGALGWVLDEVAEIQERSNERRARAGTVPRAPSQLALLHFAGRLEELGPHGGDPASG